MNIGSEKRIEGIPVDSRRSSIDYTAKYTYDYRPIPGGAAWSVNGDLAGTTATPAHDDDDGKSVVVTAAHIFYVSQQSEFWQYSASSNADGFWKDHKFDGDEDIYGGYDAATVGLHGHDVEYDFASRYSNSYQGLSIYGSLSRTGIKDLQDRNASLNKQGATTGLKSGEIIDVKTNQFQTNHENKDGDSGGPVYKPYYDGLGDYAYIGGVVSGNDSGGAVHTLMDSIENDLNVTV